MENDSKKWWESSGVWGGLATLVGLALQFMGYGVDIQTTADITAWFVSVGTAVSAGIALWGRISATKKVSLFNKIPVTKK